MSKALFAQRRDSRVAAMQYLFAWSMNAPQNLSEDLRAFYETQEHPREHYAYADEVVDGVIRNLVEIDARIRTLAQNWEFDRIARIDLTILRVAIYEMIFRKDVPPVVSINEAINLSKTYSNSDAKRFINGILDRLKDQLGRDARKAGNDTDAKA
ncbi:transcription antitermination factor NusB [Opitutaceae bacterium TAV4]|uniref:transcription antitermination factor NusB n=1 Tax=Geminisphaera colitermitum TaxID=1148786 RepID=UPI000158C6C9|nr:transcription antitermination factor NusB [Geminisphaera colitermitum]RRJ96312.1 transcription antitermination factor NusB [Opitutaceae bacterium TAV4]RRK00457.1 transcription antitermination factor NusB [Opitutaceae bacterium TAV3]